MAETNNVMTEPCSVCEGRGHKLIGCEETGYGTSTCWACRGSGRTMVDQVRLIIDVDNPHSLIGGADFGTAITDRTIALANEIRPILRKYGHTKALLALDANECLEAEHAT
jgi:hypothetical protein